MTRKIFVLSGTAILAAAATFAPVQFNSDGVTFAYAAAANENANENASTRGGRFDVAPGRERGEIASGLGSGNSGGAAGPAKANAAEGSAVARSVAYGEARDLAEELQDLADTASAEAIAARNEANRLKGIADASFAEWQTAQGLADAAVGTADEVQLQEVADGLWGDYQDDLAAYNAADGIATTKEGEAVIAQDLADEAAIEQQKALEKAVKNPIASIGDALYRLLHSK